MELKNFKAGSFREGYEYQYFLPEKINHSFFWTDQSINQLLEKASLKIGELNSFSRFVPDADMFIIMHIFKEAVLSSRIEGTLTDIEGALIEEHEIEPEKRDDWKEVNNYVAAMNGNGRIGRLLITLYLVSNNILDQPLLYLSAFFEKNKTLYYENLTLVRTKNNLDQWLKFFLTGIIQTAETAAITLKKITDLKSVIENERIFLMGKRTQQAMSLLGHLFKKPMITIKDTQTITGLSTKAANALVKVFVEHKILVETTGYQRNRLFLFDEYVKMFY